MATAPDTVCADCGTVFKTPWSLRRHQGRKRACANDGAAKHKCARCSRPYSSSSALRRHMRESCKGAPPQGVAPQGVAPQDASPRDDASRMRAMQAQIDALTQLVETQRAAPRIDNSSTVGQHIDNSTVSQHIDNSRHITVNVFGRENTDHITGTRIRHLLDAALRLPSLEERVKSAIHEATLLIYSDPGHPENITCYLSDPDAPDVMVRREAGWEPSRYDRVAHPMTQGGVNMLFNKQPWDDPEPYGPLLIELRDHETSYVEETNVRKILVENWTKRVIAAEERRAGAAAAVAVAEAAATDLKRGQP